MAPSKAKAKIQKPVVPAQPGISRGQLLVVEDENDLRELLVFNLAKQGYTVQSTESGEKALSLVRRQEPDLILLDLMMPGMDGLELCRTLKADKETSNIPVVMLTAKGEETDVVVGLEMGADDYITKPFSTGVLCARIRAVLRRRSADREESTGKSAALKLDRLEVLPDRHEVRVDGKTVDLTATEFRLLYLLARRAGRVFTRQQIIDLLHEGFAAVTDRSVDVQVVSLRRKLGALGERVETVRGVGYRYREDGGE